MIRRPPRSTPFPTRRSSDLQVSMIKCNISFSFSYAHCFIRMKRDRKSTRLNSSHVSISYAVFCLKKKKYELRSLLDAHTRLAFCSDWFVAPTTPLEGHYASF